MPCYVTGTSEGDANLHAAEAQKAATSATRVACEALRYIEEKGDIHHLSISAQQWWREHRVVDGE